MSANDTIRGHWQARRTMRSFIVRQCQSQGVPSPASTSTPTGKASRLLYCGHVVAKAVAPTMVWTCALALSCVRNETRIEISIISMVFDDCACMSTNE